jgi:SPW repeat-containing protein
MRPVARDRERRLLRRGSVPLVLHGLAEYGVGVLLIASSSLFSYDSDTATAVSILLGAALLAITAVSDIPTALLRRIPVGTHILLDFVIGVLLVASPFIFGFSDDAAALASFLLIGLGYLLLTALTRFGNRE